MFYSPHIFLIEKCILSSVPKTGFIFFSPVSWWWVWWKCWSAIDCLHLVFSLGTWGFFPLKRLRVEKLLMLFICRVFIFVSRVLFFRLMRTSCRSDVGVVRVSWCRVSVTIRGEYLTSRRRFPSSITVCHHVLPRRRVSFLNTETSSCPFFLQSSGCNYHSTELLLNYSSSTNSVSLNCVVCGDKRRPSVSARHNSRCEFGSIDSSLFTSFSFHF